MQATGSNDVVLRLHECSLVYTCCVSSITGYNPLHIADGGLCSLQRTQPNAILMQGLMYTHPCGLHNDVKAANIFLHQETSIGLVGGVD